MINKVREIINKCGMLDFGDRIVVGVSGGPDSIALLQSLAILSDEYRITLIAAHLNHGLRGRDSNEEEDFASVFSKSLGLIFESKTLDIRALSKEHGKSIEETGRDERYEFLTQIAKKHGAGKIALGHHLHDRVETVLMNVMRGCGIEGLRGILPVRDGIIIRPLLSSTRDEILSFLEAQRLSYMNDSSNFENTYLRNRIRNRLLPLLKMQYNPNIETTIAHLSEIAVQDDACLQAVVDQAMSQLGIDLDGQEKEITFNIPIFLLLHEAIQRRVIKTLIESIATAGKPIGYVHVKSVLDLVHHGHSSGKLNLPGSIEIRREYEHLSIIRKPCVTRIINERCSKGESSGFSYDVVIPGRIEICELGIVITFDFVKGIPSRADYNKSNVIYMDYDRLPSLLMIRNRKSGDRIQLLGMEGSKKVKSYLIDKKIPRHRRREVPLLVDRESVLWVIGMDMSERVKITGKTLKVVKAEII